VVEVNFSRNLTWLYIIVVVLLSILGALLVASNNNPLLLYVYVPLISVAPIIYLKSSEHSSVLDSAFIYVLSITLCYHILLSSWYLAGSDIQVEHYLAQRVLENGFWDPHITHNYNSALSVTILAPILQFTTSISLPHVFKVIYPLIYSIIPVILYKMFLKLSYERKDSFLAVFYFISMFPFYTELLQIAKQMIAEVLLAIFLYLVVTWPSCLRNASKTILLLLMLQFGIVFSHYGTYYIWFSILMISEIIFLVLTRRKVLLYVVIASYIFQYLYYVTISGSSVLKTALITIQMFIENISAMLSPYHAQGIEYVVKEKTTLHQVLTYMYLTSLIIVALGVSQKLLWLLRYAIKDQVNGFHNKNIFYYSLSVVAGIFFLISGLSTLSAALNITRIYHLSAFILAPSFIDGYNFIGKAIKGANKKTIWACFLAIFLLFNTGYMYEIANMLGYSEQSFSGALNPHMDRATLTSQDYYATLWLKELIHPAISYQIYTDLIGKNNIRAYLNESMIKLLTPNSSVSCNSLIFVRRNSILYGFLTIQYVGNVQLCRYIKTDMIVNFSEVQTIFSGGAIIFIKTC